MRSHRAVAAVLAAVAALVGSVVAEVTVDSAVGQTTSSAVAATGGFVGVVPARLWETRRANDLLTVDGQAEGTGPLGPATSSAGSRPAPTSSGCRRPACSRRAAPRGS